MNETQQTNGYEGKQDKSPLPLADIEQLKQKMSSIERDGQTLIKQNPVWALIGASAVGYALGKLLTSSGRRS